MLKSPARSLLERKNRVLAPCLYHFFGDSPVELVHGSGVHVWDSAGKRYLDFYSGVGVNSLGHCHPEVVEAATRQMNLLQHTTTIYLTEPMIRLAEELVAVTDGRFQRVFFCADGSGANEGAMIAARIATGRRLFMAFDTGLHGRTSLTMAATGVQMWKADPFGATDVMHVSHPAVVGMSESLAEVESLIDTHGGQFAAFIAEPICANGGVLVPPPEYFRALKLLLQQEGVLLIADEVQTGFCRTGRWFGMEHWNVDADVQSVAKALGNGLPIAAWMGTEEVVEKVTSPQASTFGGNLVPVAAALKVIEIMRRDCLADRAHHLGERLLGGLRRVAADSDRAGEVRGLGLMVGMEIVGGEGEPDAQGCDAVLRSLRDAGVLVGKTGVGRNVLTLEPPLIVTEEQIDEVLSKIEAALVTECLSAC